MRTSTLLTIERITDFVFSDLKKKYFRTIQSLIEVYSKKKLKHAATVSKAAAKEIKNNGKLFNHKIDNSNFKQPILIFDHLAQPFVPPKSKKDFNQGSINKFFLFI